MNDPNIIKYKIALKQLGDSIKLAHKTKEGKQLSSDYWVDVIKLLKKAKLGISMMELGIENEDEISITHDQSQIDKEDDKNVVSQQPQSTSDGDSENSSTKSKLASIGLKSENLKKYQDTLNHFSILLSEKFESVKKNGTDFIVDFNNRKFTIKFDGKFFMISEDYNFEIGEGDDIQNTVETLSKLVTIPHNRLVEDYNLELY